MENPDSVGFGVILFKCDERKRIPNENYNKNLKNNKKNL